MYPLPMKQKKGDFEVLSYTFHPEVMSNVLYEASKLIEKFKDIREAIDVHTYKDYTSGLITITITFRRLFSEPT